MSCPLTVWPEQHAEKKEALLGLDSHSYEENDFDYQLAQLATLRVVCVIILNKHWSLCAQLKQHIYDGESTMV